MKNFISSFAAAAALLFPLTLSLSSCSGRASMDAPNTHNPPERALNGTGFGLVVLDGERGFSKDSNYVFEGEWRDGHFWFGREKLDTMQLNITPTNSIVLKISSEDPAFEGVNAASSSRCIDIVPDAGDRSSFHLEWVEEGQSRITLWCGEGPARHEISFIATSRKEIPMTGIKVRIDGVESEMAVFTADDFYDWSINKVPNETSLNHVFFSKPNLADIGLKRYQALVQEYNSGYHRNYINEHVVFEIAGPVPLNATPTEHIYMAINDLCFYEPDPHLLTNTFTPGYVGSPPARFGSFPIYYENFYQNPDLNWFEPVLCTEELRSDVFKIIKYFESSENSKLYPADLRERLIWVWPGRTGELFRIAFYQGNIHKKYSDPNHPEIFGRYYDTVYQKMIAFHAAPYSWEDYTRDYGSYPPPEWEYREPK